MSRGDVLISRRVVLAMPLAALLAGCGSGSPSDRDHDAAFGAAPEFDDAAAWIEIGTQVFDSSGSTFVEGHLITAPAPWPYQVEAPVGACRYSTVIDAVCSPFCDYSEVCIDGGCVAEPIQHSAGDLTISGSGVTRTVPFVDGAYYLYEQTALFATGSAVTVTASGADVAAFSAVTEMPAPLELLGLADLALRAGTDLTVRWRPADPGARIRLVLGADRGHARHRAALIECDLPDEAGSVTIPASTITRFVDPANWSCGDCFSQEIKRYRRARTTAGSTPVDLWLAQTESIYLVPE